MRIEKINIRNYRGIRNSGWIEFNRLNAIVGKNDAGKSSILHAINAFYNETKLTAEDRYYGATDEETVIEVQFYGEELEKIPSILLDSGGFLHIKKHASQTGDSYKTSIIVRDFGNSAYKNIFQLTAAKCNSICKGIGMVIPETCDKESLYQLVDELMKTETDFALEEYEIKGTILKGILKELYPQYSLFLADTSLDTGASAFQNQFKKIITTAIEAHIEEFDNLKSEVSHTLNEEIKKIGEYMVKHYPSMNQLTPNISYDWSKLVNFEVIMKDSAEYEVSLSHKGTGIQRLFMVSYFQYLAEHTVNDEESYIFAIEEPETFLHPGAQRTLLESLKKIAEHHQVIITTHSPVFASEVNNKNIIVAQKTHTESIYNQGDNISAELLAEELGVRANDNILNSKLLIFVEGSNDVKFWEIVYEKFVGHKYEDDNILFVPGGGSELHNIAEMNLMSKLNRNFMVIIDRDAGATDYNTKLEKQQKLKSFVENKGGELIVLRKREIENYYSPRVVMEMLRERGIQIDNLEIAEYDDVPNKMKLLSSGRNIQMKFKNNMDIFAQMTLEDWKQVSCFEEEGQICYEFTDIVNQIQEKLNI